MTWTGAQWASCALRCMWITVRAGCVRCIAGCVCLGWAVHVEGLTHHRKIPSHHTQCRAGLSNEEVLV